MPKNRDFQENREVIGRFIKARQPGPADAYTKVGDKTTGLSTGYEGEQDNQRYILKSGVMTPSSAQEDREKRDLIYEYMASPMFSRLLYAKTANIGIAIDKPVANLRSPKQTSPDVAYIASRRIDGFEPLDGYIFYNYRFSDDLDKDQAVKGEMLVGLDKGQLVLKDKNGIKIPVRISNNIQQGISEKHYIQLMHHINKVPGSEKVTTRELAKYGLYQFGYAKSEELKASKGFEKNLAACMFLGDGDYHADNLGVVVKDGEFLITKIDHGRAYYFDADERILRKQLFRNLLDFYYGEMTVDVQKLKEAIEESLNIQEEEIENIVKKQSYQLRKLGIKLDDNLLFALNGQKRMMAQAYGKGKDEQENRYNNMEQNYIQLYKLQKQAFMKLSQSLEIIIKIDMPEQWHKKSWIYDIQGLDPIHWAVFNKKTIEGIDPVNWAIKNGKKIEERNPVDWAVIKQRLIEGLDPISWAIKNKQTIGGVPPITYAIRNDQLIEGKSPIFWAIRNKELIDRMDPVDWAIRNEKLIEGINPLIWGALSGNKSSSSIKEENIHNFYKHKFHLLNEDWDKVQEYILGIKIFTKEERDILFIAKGSSNMRIARIAKGKLSEMITKDFQVEGLFEAIKLGSIEKATQALYDPENANIDFKGRIALHEAIRLDKRDISKLLIARGADSNRSTISGMRALHLSVIAGQDDVVEALINSNADVNAEFNGMTALHMAVISGRDIISIMLVNAGADLTLVNKKGQTPLDLAKEKNNEKLVQLIEEKMNSKSSKEQRNSVSKILSVKKRDISEFARREKAGDGSNATTRSNSLDRNTPSPSR
jgi:uncharacterized protein